MQGTVHTTITQTTRYGNAIVLQASGVAMWGYVFSSQRQAEIKQQVVGKSRGQAQAILLHTLGVQTVSVEGTRCEAYSSDLHCDVAL